MTRLTLSMVLGDSPWVAPLASGEVRPEGIDLLVTRSDPSETFWRQLRFREFDTAEMSLSSFLIARERGVPMVGLPVFPGRRFMHTELYTHVGSGVDSPSALAGKRIGVAEYQQSSAVWTRGVLQHDFDVPPTGVEWFMERPPERSQGGATGFTPPPGIQLRRVEPGRSLDEMLAAGELDAAPAGRARFHSANAVDTTTNGTDWSQLSPVFPDPVAEARRFVTAHGYVPANHVYVVDGDVHRRHPWVAYNLYQAFLDAKALAARRLRATVAEGMALGREFLRQHDELFGPDPVPYGVSANQRMLEDLCQYSREQGLTTHPVSVPELFAEPLR